MFEVRIPTSACNKALINKANDCGATDIYESGEQTVFCFETKSDLLDFTRTDEMFSM